jgi:hypothetical protein
MLPHTLAPAHGQDLLNMETWAASRALKKKCHMEQWLAHKAAAACAPLALMHTALILEISAALTAQPDDTPLMERAEALLDTDIDRLILRAATTVRSVRRHAHMPRGRHGLDAKLI